MQLLTIGLNHTSAPIAVREQLVFNAPELPQTLAMLRGAFIDAPALLSEVALVSTCNRTEVYCATAAAESSGQRLTQWLAQVAQVSVDELRSHLYRHRADASVRHAFRVASGLDSMVLGEPQILGQMKTAARAAHDAGSMGTLLHQLFQRTFKVAKEVRTTTEIGMHSVSMAVACVRLAQRIFGNLSQCNVLLVGAGEMIELVATHLAAQHPARLVVANRTVERAQRLSERFRGEAVALKNLPEILPDFDVVITCTAASLPIIGLGMVARAVKARKRKPIMMVDLAVPRDIEPEVADLSDVYLYTIDALGQIVTEGREARAASVAQAEAIIDLRVCDFNTWLNARRLLPYLHSLKNDVENLRKTELELAKRHLARGEAAEVVLEKLTRNLSNKLLHGPIHVLSEGRADDTTVKLIGNLHKRAINSALKTEGS
jgi:glutamyl-tRNA reductase